MIRAGKSNGITWYIGNWGTFVTYSFHSQGSTWTTAPEVVLLLFNLYGEREWLCCYIFIDGEC